VEADLAALEEHIGSLVRVGGLVTETRPDGFLLDDGTAVEAVVLTGEAAAYRALVRTGDAIGLVGLVAGEGTNLRLVVDDPAGIVRLGALGEAIPIAATSAAEPAATPVAPSGVAAASFSGPIGPFGWLGAGWLGASGVLALSATSLIVTLVRRRRARQRLIRTLAARIAGLSIDQRSVKPRGGGLTPV
jgi:hypothetical protein